MWVMCMNEETQAVTTTEAPVTESAPVESSTVNSTEAPEKAEITNEAQQDGGASEVGSDGKVIPYDRFHEKVEEANRLKEELQAIKAQQEEAQRLAQMTPEEQVQQQQLEVAKETLKKLGFVTKEEQEQMRQEEKAANMFISECNRLEGKYDGKDGMPPFKAREVAEYMDELASQGQYISDPETAYKLKHLDEIAEIKAKAQRSSAYSEKQQGGMNQVTDERQAELDAATQAGDFTTFLKKFAGMPKN